jgi:hypothetical protein
MTRFPLQRVFLLMTVLWGAAIFWVAPHPPMVDLAQHAGQITLLHDLIAQQSNWASLVRVNLLTPYLLGYGLALPLTFLVPVAVAIKIVLSLAYLGFVMAAVALRRWCGGDPRLDWLMVLGYFGFSYNYGLYTFLVAAPIALLVILCCAKYAAAPSRRQGLIVLVAGLVLLASHGLSFVFAVGVGALVYLLHCRSIKGFFAHLWPFVCLAIACALYFVASKMTEAEIAAPYGAHISWRLGVHRVHELVLHSFGIAPKRLFMGVALIMLAYPWLLGLRPRFDNKLALAMLFVVVFISFLFPNFALKTALLYQRFAIFFLPAYALAFTGAPRDGPPNASAGILAARRLVLMPLVMVGCWAVLASYTLEAHRFGKESAGIDSALQKIAPGTRALALVLDEGSEAVENRVLYANYASWYQAEHAGFVDFNFAWFPPQIVRFRPALAPSVNIDFVPKEFDWTRHHGELYRYFIVRGALEESNRLFDAAPCKPVLVDTVSAWRIYENRPCKQ